ncbi:unnamed protein product [Phytophthora fragariaefolia]|uniref:Unnamed protein product n=1 Tax=Phytophthora fragariaefolia TaxID=1490495 RepID=A0A9W7DD41_9STRA|nr:unnamed protein product [Phytophthora fragariaefolia]
MGAGITPREHLNEVAESLIPAKGRVRKPPVLSVEMLDDTYQGIVLSFDGAAKTSTRRGSCGCILWQLPDWKVLEARGFILDDVSVNAERSPDGAGSASGESGCRGGFTNRHTTCTGSYQLPSG